MSNAAAARVHVLTFFSQGKPFDGGINLRRSASLHRAAFEPNAATYVGHTPTSIRNLSVGSVTGASVLQPIGGGSGMNPGYGAMGGGRFKVFAILHRLRQLRAAGREGELLVWKDANVFKHPNLLGGAARLGEAAEWAMREAAPTSGVFMPYENLRLRAHHHCKGLAVRGMGAAAGLSAAEVATSFTYPLHHANELVLRVGPEADAFVLAWLRACARDDWLGVSPDPTPRQPHFRWHTFEQCLFTLLAAQRPRMYRRRLMFHWVMLPECARDLPYPSYDGPTTQGQCRPTWRDAVGWAPQRPTSDGLCMVVVCRGRLHPISCADLPAPPAGTTWYGNSAYLVLRPPTGPSRVACDPGGNRRNGSSAQTMQQGLGPRAASGPSPSSAHSGAPGSPHAGERPTLPAPRPAPATPNRRAAPGAGLFPRSRARRGYCRQTTSGPSDCERGDSGSWPLIGSELDSYASASVACAVMCGRCTRCRVVSFSRREADCSWFHACQLSALEAAVPGFLTLEVDAAAADAAALYVE